MTASEARIAMRMPVTIAASDAELVPRGGSPALGSAGVTAVVVVIVGVITAGFTTVVVVAAGTTGVTTG